MITQHYPRTRHADGSVLPVYPALAMMGETGELAEKIISTYHQHQTDYLKEIGDVLWYVTAAACDLGYSLNSLTRGAGTFTEYGRCIGPSYSDVRNQGLQLAAFAGRFSERVKKAWRDGTPLNPEACANDLRNVLGTLHQITSCYYATLGEVAVLNIEKLRSRRERGVLAGSRDNR